MVKKLNTLYSHLSKIGAHLERTIFVTIFAMPVDKFGGSTANERSLHSTVVR